MLVHGAAGGVGTAALQIARATGANTIAVVSSDEKEAVARTAGADEVVRSDGEWLAQVRELTGGRGVDVVYDPVGGRALHRQRARPGARGPAAGDRLHRGPDPVVAVNRLLLKNVAVVGVGWGAFVFGKPELVADIAADLERMAGEGFVDPIVGATYPLAEGARP